MNPTALSLKSWRRAAHQAELSALSHIRRLVPIRSIVLIRPLCTRHDRDHFQAIWILSSQGCSPVPAHILLPFFSFQSPYPIPPPQKMTSWQIRDLCLGEGEPNGSAGDFCLGARGHRAASGVGGRWGMREGGGLVAPVAWKQNMVWCNGVIGMEGGNRNRLKVVYKGKSMAEAQRDM